MSRLPESLRVNKMEKITPRKRKFSGDDDDDEKVKKKLKFSIEVENESQKKQIEKLSKLIKENENQFEEFLKQLRGEKKKIVFSKCNTDSAVLDTFGILRDGFKKWVYDFSKMKDLEEELKKIVEVIKKDFKKRKNLNFGGDECVARSFIDAVLYNSLVGFECTIRTGLNVKGKFTHGPLDYALLKNGVIAIVIEAKEKGINQGTSQCLQQLKAVHEQFENYEEKRNVYYGFSATDTFWVPIVYYPNKEGRWKDKINIGEKYGVNVDDDLKKVVYMLRMIMSE